VTITREALAIINELLPAADPNQAYTMGAVSVMALKDGLQPDRQLLYAASTVPGIGFCETIYNAWKRSKGVLP
jgi:hypothetical protein